MSDVIGFLGAGQLGEPMVKRLLSAGHQVLVYARRAEVRDRLKNEGAVLADSVADLSAGADILISCLFSDAQLSELSTGRDGFAAHAKSGAVFVSHTTGSVSTLTELVASAPGLVVIDAPVSGTAEDIAAGTLTVLIGGPSEAVARAEPVLRSYASSIIATGELGTGLYLKLINNLLFAANTQLVAAATHLGQRLGIDPPRLVDALTVCSGASAALSYVKRTGSMEAFEAGVAPFLRKDIAACLVAAEQAGVDLGLLGTVVETGSLSLTVSSVPAEAQQNDLAITNTQKVGRL